MLGLGAVRLPQSEPSEHESAGCPSVRRTLGRTCRGEVSLPCVSPCESAAPPSGWKPCCNGCTYRVFHLNSRRDNGFKQELVGDLEQKQIPSVRSFLMQATKLRTTPLQSSVWLFGWVCADGRSNCWPHRIKGWFGFWAERRTFNMWL